MNATSARDRIEKALRRIDDDAARSVMTLRLDERALAEADRADADRRQIVPITIKDNFDVAGYATTAGSKLLAGADIAKQDAAVVSRLIAAGYVPVGRTNMTEFAFSGLGINPHYGTPVNPLFRGAPHIPGGSSSGAAVSVAIGMVEAAVGTDTGGSIRIPAAWCGLVGFKPTASAVSREGILPLSPTLDSIGVIARSVALCGRVFDAIRDRPAPQRYAATRPRIAVLSGYIDSNIEEDVRRIFCQGVERLRGADLEVGTVVVPEFSEVPGMLREATFPAFEAFGWHSQHLTDERREDYDPRVLERIEAGGAMSRASYAMLIERRASLIERVEARLAEWDAVIWPTVHFMPPTLASLADDFAYRSANVAALRNSTVVNLIDGCAITLPCQGSTSPVGMTIASTRNHDDSLLSIATLIESIMGANHADHQTT